MSWPTRRVLPGLNTSLALVLPYLALLLVLPLAACLVKACSLSPSEFWAAVSSRQAQAAYKLTFGASAIAAVLDLGLGMLIAWVLVRYRFPGRRFLDAVVDLPFALPTAVAGLVYSALYVKNGWFGQFLVPLGIEGSYSRLAIVLVLMFLGLPFVVRTVQPVLETMDRDVEEAAASLGASRWQTFLRVLLPALAPGIVTGGALAFARGLGEYGSVVFVSGNMPFRTEIAPVLIVARLEEFKYAEATAIATVLLGASLVSLGLINWLQRRYFSHAS